MNNEAPVLIDYPIAHVGRITLNRAKTRNAQNTQLLYALNDAFDTLAAKDDVRVIVLAALGPHFSAGHDLYEAAPDAEELAAITKGYRAGEPGLVMIDQASGSVTSVPLGLARRRKCFSPVIS